MLKIAFHWARSVFPVLALLAFSALLSACERESLAPSAFETTCLIDADHPDCADIQFGFEGGDVHKIGGTYHMILTERFGEMVTVKNRFGYWKSQDGERWKRISTVLQFDYDTTGKIPNACIFSPKLVFSEGDNRWVLFYIQFKSSPDRTGDDGWYKRYDGQVMLSRSQTEGTDGIAGPYDIGNVVFKRSESSSWEGLQGITGFAPYQVDGRWYALYGSANTEKRPCSHWRLGLAAADSLTGSWTAVESQNPFSLPIRAEAPQVLRVEDAYYAVIDEIGGKENFSLLVSGDGVDWRYATELEFLDRQQWTWKELRTPVGFMRDGDHFKTFFTTYYKNTDFAPLRQLQFDLK